MKRATSGYRAEAEAGASDPKGSKPRRARKTHNNNNNNIGDGSSAQNRRSSVYRGVTRHRWTGRYEAHLWDKNCWNHGQNKKGRQVYLGAYDDEEAAARTYDLAALKYWGTETVLNFPLSSYTKEIEEMKNVSREEYLASLRRRSSGFSRGVSKYRGVARHHHNGRWEARIGRVLGNKYLYLGTYSTQEEAATAYDMAAIEYRGLNAVTNFDLSRYIGLLAKTKNSCNSNNSSSSSTSNNSSHSSTSGGTAKATTKKVADTQDAEEQERDHEEIPNADPNPSPKPSSNNANPNSSGDREEEKKSTETSVGTTFSDDIGLFFSEAGGENMLCSEPELYLSVDGIDGDGQLFHESLDSLCGSDLLEDLVDPFLDAISIPSFPNIAIRSCS